MQKILQALWLQRTPKTFVEPLLGQKGGTVDAPPGDSDPDGSGMDVAHGSTQVRNKFHVVASDHRHNSTSGANSGMPHEK